MKYLTRRKLEKMEACPEALKVFKERFGKRAFIREVVKYLNETGKENWQIWLLAQKLKLTAAFIENGADIHTSNDQALLLAAYEGHLEVVKLLIKNGANVHTRNDEALSFAAREGHFKVVKFLIKNGADVHTRNDRALREAKRMGHTGVTELLEQVCLTHSI